MSRNNQELAAGRTDEQGLVRFRGLDPEDAGSRPFVVVATQGSDLSFLAFDETAIPTADYDVGGVNVPEKGYRAFMYGDRDIYRPGGTLHLAWMVRDADLQPAPDIPLNLEILGPGGEEFATTRVICDAAGCGEYEAAIPRWAQTGRYTAVLSLGEDRPLGGVRFSVEDFLPDRMKVTGTLSADGVPPTVVGPDASLELSAQAMSLFGPPAAGRQAEASVWFRHTPVSMPGYEEFHFGVGGHRELPPRRNLGSVKTDDQGRASWDVPLPEAPDFQGWLRLTALVKVTELGGGRAVSSTVETDFAPVDRVLGLRDLDEGVSDYREPGQPVSFEAVLLDLAGQPQADPAAQVRLLRRNWRTVLKKGGSGGYRYVSEYDEKLVSESVLALKAGPTALEVTPTSHGSYRLEVVSGDGKVRGSVNFYVYGFGYSPWAMSNPEKVNLKLDQKSYAAGGLVTASVEAPFPGLMLVTVEREKVFSRQWVRLEENTGTVKIRLPKDAAPNVYLTATLLRPLDELDPRAPARAFGAQPIFLDRGPRTLPVEMVTVESMRPRQPLKVRVKLPADPAPMRLTVAAVDEGILQLTDYETPSPLEHFLARRRLGVTTFDIWSLLLPEFERVQRKSAAGGGMEMSAALEQAKRLNPLAANRVKPVALWSGLLVGKPGWQEISLDVPQFNGSLRVMAVATAGDRFGSAQDHVRVADPLVLSPSLPRFLAPGDRFAAPVPVYNALDGAAGEAVDVTVDLTLAGPVEAAPQASLTRTVPIARGAEQVSWFDLQAGNEVGVAKVTFGARAGDESVSMTTELPVRPPHALETRVTSGSLRAAKAQVSLNPDWLPGTNVTTITVAANPAAAYGAALPFLLRYPYGCLEQKTSSCFPLLHFGALAASLAPGQFGRHDGDYFINSGLDYLATLYRPGTGFVMWPGGGYDNRNPFATVYATHFLVEAKKAGYVVPEGILAKALRDIAAYARSGTYGWPDRWTDSHRLVTRAYACYVLAVAEAPERGAMDQLLRDEWRNLSAASRTHLAGAYALTGNRARFEELLPAVDAPVDDTRATGFTWRSAARDEAMRLEVLATVAPDHIQVPRLMQRLGQRAENGRWYTTQENAFALLALGKLAAAGRLEPASGTVLVGDREVGSFQGEDFSIQSREWAGRTVTIRTEGTGTAWYSIRDEGIPVTPAVSELDAGLTVRREYFDTEGEPVDPLAIRQGQTLVCRLLLQSDKGSVEDVVISDLVPAGLEIENPRLSRDGGYEWVQEDAADYRALPVDHLEVRDDRLLLFTRATAQTAVFHYTLRAVTAGHFVLPAVRAEAMYDPEVMGISGAGEIQVERP